MVYWQLLSLWATAIPFPQLLVGSFPNTENIYSFLILNLLLKILETYCYQDCALIIHHAWFGLVAEVFHLKKGYIAAGLSLLALVQWDYQCLGLRTGGMLPWMSPNPPQLSCFLSLTLLSFLGWSVHCPC